MNWAARRGRLVDQLLERDSLDSETERAMRAVPRHAFVPESKREAAYEDRPLPIGEGQTISAPHMVAIMTDLLDLSAGDRVLEIGTGCGYHAAVTAEIVGPGKVCSVEYHDSLARDAGDNLRRVGAGDISIRVGDGREGWEAHAPYDRVYLTCAAEEFPRPVRNQVAVDGIVLGPVERSGLSITGNGQVLVRARKQADGSLDPETHGGVRFVPLQ
jgi:protein-L-isoaspartate(D-aspartate) O-methyltransferase